MLHILAAAAVLLFQSGDLPAPLGQAQDRVGDAYGIHLTRTTESSTDDGSSSSSSRSGGTLVERILAVRDDGLELEFDLPPEATAEDRARDWQWPARVLKTTEGSLQLLNAPELEARIETWLALGGMTREACGHWIFTWNAFKIECDPQSVIDTLRPYDLRGDVREGARYDELGGLGPTFLRPESTGPDGSIFVAETPIDPDFVRRERAEAAEVVAEITGGEPEAIVAAAEARAVEDVAGVITTTLATDGEGHVVRRTTVASLTTTNAEGVVERTISTETAERRPLPSRAP